MKKISDNDNKFIKIRGARVHNLKNISIDLPRQKLVVITGLSGSGKSSLAFDTIYAEGQRRYVESLSAYARQFLGLKDKPDVDKIEGLSPTISIDQKSVSQNPRSTVGTITEIHDYLRLLFSRVGKPHCPNCGQPVSKQNVSQITNEILKIPARRSFSAGGKAGKPARTTVRSGGEPVLIIAPQVRGKKGERLSLFDEIAQAGFLRVRVDGEVLTIEEAKKTPLDKNKKHTIEIIVDRIVIDKDLERSRLAESIELALKIGDGILIVGVQGKEDKLFSENYACIHCGINLPAIEPRNFSFNSPYGACPVCTGLGSRSEVEPDLVIPNKRLTLAEGAIRPWASASHRLGRQSWYYYQLEELSSKYGFSLDKTVSELPEKIINLIMRGDKNFGGNYEGVIPELERKWSQTDSDWVRAEIEKYMMVKKCPACLGKRLRPEALAVKIFDYSIADWSALPISEIRKLFFKFSKNAGKEKFSRNDFSIAGTIIKEVLRRLDFMLDVGLDYLTLDRESTTLSGGEAQRIRLATQIGSGLVGVTYILDEPSIGLHERDQKRLLETLVKLRDMGNSVIVVEHDRQTIESADWVCDIGPGAGEYGGRVIFEGTAEELKKSKTLTGEYISGRKGIDFFSSSEISNPKSQFPNKSQSPNSLPAGDLSKGDKSQNSLIIRGASENNLKNIDVKIPLGRMVAVTGVSGSGKSTLVNDILAKSLLKNFYNAKDEPGAHKKIEGAENIDKVVLVDQSPIGRTPRSNPATYTGAFTQIRDLFTKTHLARIRGYSSGRFSFNVKGGRCEVCEGQGVKKIEMYFLPDVYVECEECKGKRYNREALEVDYKGKSIADVLEMSVEEAVKFFNAIPGLSDKLKTLNEVGLGYMKIGQSAPSLSGGEAQRVKLATELSRRSTGQTLYILDEPTTGLHFDDIKKLLGVLKELVAKGNTVLIIEHNMDVIRNSDWIIDLGPEGGDKGGRIIAQGTPSQVAKSKSSYTGRYLAKLY